MRYPARMDDRKPVHRAECHCGRITIEVHAALPRRVYDCNCSICTKKGYLHWFVPRDRVRILAADGDLATYTFLTGQAKHHFCRSCGVAPFYVARSHPDAIDVNIRCVPGVDLASFEVVPFDGQNWEQAVTDLRTREP
ncbi:MAG: GFA family protein [Myxococcota bacterium]